jgi:predicted nicotinamide N-methyase
MTQRGQHWQPSERGRWSGAGLACRPSAGLLPRNATPQQLARRRAQQAAACAAGAAAAAGDLRAIRVLQLDSRAQNAASRHRRTTRGPGKPRSSMDDSPLSKNNDSPLSSSSCSSTPTPRDMASPPVSTVLPDDERARLRAELYGDDYAGRVRRRRRNPRSEDGSPGSVGGTDDDGEPSTSSSRRRIQKVVKEIQAFGRRLKLAHYPEVVERSSDGVQLTGSTLWDAGLALAAHMEQMRPAMGGSGGEVGSEEEERRPLSVLELGAGCGAVGLALALGGDEALLTDNQPEVLTLLRDNVERNGLGRRASVEALDWDRPPSLALARRGWDLIVAADIVYGLSDFTPLLRFLEALAHPRTTLVFAFGNRQRRSREDQRFMAQLRERGHFDVLSSTEVPGFSGVEVVTFRRKPVEWSSDDETWLDSLEVAENDAAGSEPEPEPELGQWRRPGQVTVRCDGLPSRTVGLDITNVGHDPGGAQPSVFEAALPPSVGWDSLPSLELPLSLPTPSSTLRPGARTPLGRLLAGEPQRSSASARGRASRGGAASAPSDQLKPIWTIRT